MTVKECLEAAEECDKSTLGLLAGLGEMIVQRLSQIGANTGLASHRDNGGSQGCKALRGALVSLYTTFVPCRKAIRKAISEAALSTVQSCRRLNPQVMGVRLHALDGGPKDAELTLEGVAALLEVLGAIIRGFRRPIEGSHHALLWGCLIPMHANTANVDDVRPVLSLYHRQLMQCIGTMIEKDA